MIKVIEVITSLSDGGAETLVKDYVTLLDKNKFSAKVLVVQNVTDTANQKRVLESHTEIISVFRKYNIISRLLRLCIGYFMIPYKIRRMIETEKPDVIHVHLPMLHYVASVGKQLDGIKLLYTCHNLPSRMFGTDDDCENRAAKQLIKNNNLQIIALHEEMGNEINVLLNIDNTVVLRNGIDFSKFRNVPETKEDIRQTIGISQDAYVVGHVGRFATQKNHAFLIDVFDEIRKRKENAHLLLIGTGRLVGDIQKKVKDTGLKERVHFLSNRTDIPQLLKAMDVFVFPSLFEGLSVTMVEAQVAGVRCIASDRINRETVLSPRTILVSLEASPAEWAGIALDETRENTQYGDIELFDMNKEIERLEMLYSDEA